MKANKTPGIDGITSEFLKMFWGKLKYYVVHALNRCFEKGKLSVTLRQSVIICLPKGNKDRSLIKNWRPISLLSVVYKLASGVIADRLKESLNKIISNCQSGFMKGRYISDSTRLIYDALEIAETHKIPGLLMCIDFEKAFDSLSWKFLYKVLSFFGYSQNFIKWVKLFNTDIKAYVLQCGFLSEEINIERGCRQGDPISSYLFLLGAKILTRLVLLNPDIDGLKIEEKEFKLTQFADDTTLMLNGTQHSLQSALNTLEIFGNLSGLKMNKEKTKVIWIGSRKHCKEKLNVTVNLEWGNTEFTALGLKFSTNLDDIPSLNYNNALQNIRSEINKWKNRNLTPLGKIALIKTNLISKCVHLLTSLERSENFLKDLNTELYRFLWNNKPDKIKRSIICNDHLKGGLKMVNIYAFEKALKLTWIQTCLKNPDSQWYNMFQLICDNIDKLFKSGNEWCLRLSETLTNKFWKNILQDWHSLSKKQLPKTNSEIPASSIWYNSHICNQQTYFPDWYNKGIYLIGDIINSSGTMINFETLKDTFGCNFNILNYYTVKAKVMSFIKKYQVENTFYFERPATPYHLQIFLHAHQGCKSYYKILKAGTYDKPQCERIWDPILKTNFENLDIEAMWPVIYKNCFKCIEENQVVWFQYRILFKILGTKDYLKKVKLVTNSVCGLCSQNNETIEHLFCRCTKSLELWENVKQWILRKLNVTFDFNESIMILGYLSTDNKFWPLNFILTMTRQYIYKCSKKGHILNFYELQKHIMHKYKEQKSLFALGLR